MKIAAKLVSYVFHPLFMPLVGFYLIFNCGIFEVNIPVEVLKYTYLLVILFSILLPLSIIPFMLYWHMAQSIELNNRQERFAPTFFTALSLILLFFLLNQRVPISLIQGFSMAIACNAILVVFFTIFYKVSMHMIGLGGITALIAVLSIHYSADILIWLSAAVLVTGFVASARLYLEAHNPLEIITGYVVGFVASYISIILVVF